MNPEDKLPNTGASLSGFADPYRELLVIAREPDAAKRMQAVNGWWCRWTLSAAAISHNSEEHRMLVGKAKDDVLEHQQTVRVETILNLVRKTPMVLTHIPLETLEASGTLTMLGVLLPRPNGSVPFPVEDRAHRVLDS